MNQNEVIFLFFVAAAVLLILNKGRRSRHIPTKSKRLAQAKLFDEFYGDPANRGKKLRLRDYEYDHDHPFARGGTHDSHNIKLIPRKANRKKGAKIAEPSLDSRTVAIIAIVIFLIWLFTHHS